MKKIYFGIILTIILSVTCIASFASTADAVNEATMPTALMQQFGSDYLPPFISTSDDIDLAEGSVSYKELDMTLPGKNGFDLNLYRSYDSNQSRYGYKYEKYSGNGSIALEPMYRFTYTLNGVSKEVYICFDKEENLVDSFYSTSTKLGAQKVDANGTSYIMYTDAESDTGTILLTRDKSADKKYLHDSVNVLYLKYTENLDVSLGSDWSIHMPQLVYYDYVTNTNMYIRTYYYIFRTETGETLDIRYRVTYGDDETWGFDGEDNYEYTNANYTISVYSNTQAHSLGFDYNLSVSNPEGTTYYFKLISLTNNQNNLLPTAVTDRYNNVIYYTKNTDGSVKIIDSMGRVVTVSSTGITVNGGTQTKSVSYSTTKILDADRDPYDKLDCFTTSVLTVRKNQNNTTEKTEYYMKSKSRYFTTSGYTDYKPKIEKVVYPTGAYIDYEYQDTPTINKLAVNSAKTSFSGYDYQEYHITGKKTYENNTLKRSITYSPVFTSSNKTKTLTVSESMPDGTAKTSKYIYDQCSRLTSVETRVGTATEDIRKTEYSYSDIYNSVITLDLNEVASRGIRKAYVMNTREYAANKLISSVDTKYTTGNLLTYTSQGEKNTTYTYDTTYSIPLTTITQKDADTTVKTVNTLTSDKKSIASTKVYENNTLKNTISYTYNADGTVAKTTETSTEYGSIVTAYTYTYNTDGSYSITSTVNNVKDANAVTRNVQTVSNYDYLGRLVSVVDGNGNTTSYEYDMSDRIIKQINADGTYKTVSYNIAQNSVTVTDENGNATTEDYTPLGLLEKIYLNNDTSDVVGTYTYDSLGRVTREKAYQELGGASVTENYTYDNQSRVKTISGTSTAGTLDTVTYDYAYEESFTELARNTVTDVSAYDRAMLVIYTGAGETGNENDINVYVDNTVSYSDTFYGGWCKGVMLDLHDKTSLKVTSSLSSKIYVKYLKDSDEANLAGGENQTITTTYTGDSTYVKPTEVTLLDGFGNTVSETYYKHGTNTVLNKNTYKYDYNGNVIESNGGRNLMENLSNYTAKTEYDYMGNPVKIYRADGGYTTASYNKQGQQVSSTDYMGNTTTVKYDQLGRVIQSETPFDGTYTAKTLTFYDNNGNIIKSQEQNNKPGETESYTTTEYEYDSRNRLVSVKVNDGDRDIYTQYAYDSVGNMVRMVTGQTSKLSDLYGTIPDEAAVTTYEYDRFGNVTKATDAMGNSETSTYNLMGLPLSQTDRNGNTTSYTYNAYGSMLTSTTTGGGYETDWDTTSGIVNTYSKNNLLIKSVQGDSTVEYSYDEYGYVKSENTNGVINTYTNDVDGNRKTYTQKEGTNTIISSSYTYDKLNRLTVVNYGNGISARYSYNANGQLIKENRGTVTSTYTYNKAGLVTGMSNSMGNSYSYTYNLGGNQLTSDNGEYVNEYRYNDIGQLVFEYQGWDENGLQYTYDTRGNRIKLLTSDDNYTTVYTYDKNNRLQTEYKSSTGFSTTTLKSYEYDNNGNLLFKGIEISNYGSGAEDVSIGASGELDTDYVQYYRYNTANQLTEVQSESKVIYYTYDAVGRRSSKTVNGETTEHRWDGSNIVSEGGTTENVYYRGINMIAQNAGGAISYYVYNAHGDTTALFDTNGNQIYKYDIGAFGNNLSSNRTEAVAKFVYNGQYYDSETDLYYLRNRYYDPYTGRFTQEDPIKDGLNWYVYCGNNPVNFVDPTGMTLTLVGNADDVWEYFISIELLTDDKLKLEQIGGEDSIIYGVYILEYGTGDRPVGTDLVRRIIKNESYDCKVKRAHGDERTRTQRIDKKGADLTYDENDVAHSSYGSEADILIGELPIVPVDNGGETVPEQMSMQITIGHEMIHALRIMNGNFKDEYYYLDQNNKIPYEEYEVTGISYYDSNGNFVDCANWVTTENALRREQRKIGQSGHALRVGYYVW